MIGVPGVPELLLIGAIVFLLFGGKALRGLGQGIGEFTRSVRDATKEKEKD
jgi:TatA/E family protein of Tat protein translocase